MNENFNPPPDRTLKFASPGYAFNRRCGRCDKPKTQIGGTMQKVRGLRTWVCATCMALP